MNNIVKGVMGNTLRRYLVIALVASLVVTGGMFAYAYTAATQTITVSAAGADFAEIGAVDTGKPVYSGNGKIFGSYRGKIWGGILYSVNLTTDYPGDVAINVYLDNIDEMGKNYGLWMIKLRLVASTDNATAVDVQTIDRPLTLNNGVVSFVAKDLSTSAEYQIIALDGVYKAHPYAYWGTAFGAITPSLTAEVLQAK